MSKKKLKHKKKMVFGMCIRKGDPALDVLRVARHEVYELLLAPLTRLARSRMLIAGEIEETTHAIIRRLERMPIS